MSDNSNDPNLYPELYQPKPPSSSIYSNDESGFYDTVRRLPSEYHSSNQAEVDSQWAEVGTITNKEFFVRTAVIMGGITLFLGFQSDSPWHSSNFALFFWVGIIFGILLTPLYWIARVIAVRVYKNKHSDDFGDIELWDMYQAIDRIVNRVDILEGPKAFPVPESEKIDIVSARPRHYDYLPRALRSKSRYEFHKRWGFVSYFHSAILVPVILLFVVVPYLFSESTLNYGTSLEWVDILFIAIIAVGGFYGIPKAILMFILARKHFPGIPLSDVMLYLSLTRKYVDLVEPRFYRRVILNVDSSNSSLFDSVKYKLDLYSPSDAD